MTGISGRLQPAMEETAQEILQAVENIEVQVEGTSGVIIGTDGKKYKAVMEEHLVFHGKTQGFFGGDVFHITDEFIYTAGNKYIRKYNREFELISETEYPEHATYRDIQTINRMGSFVVIGNYAYGVSGDGAYNACYVFKFNLDAMTFDDVKKVTVYNWATGTSIYSFQTKSIAYFNEKLILYANNLGSNPSGAHVFEIDPNDLSAQTARKVTSNTTYLPCFVKTIDDKLIVICTQGAFNNAATQGMMYVFNNEYQLLNSFPIQVNMNPNGGYRVDGVGDYYLYANASFQSVLIYDAIRNANIQAYNTSYSTAATLEEIIGLPHICIPAQTPVVTGNDLRANINVMCIKRTGADTSTVSTVSYYILDQFEAFIVSIDGRGYFSNEPKFIRVNGPSTKIGDIRLENRIKSYVEVTE